MEFSLTRLLSRSTIFECRLFKYCEIVISSGSKLKESLRKRSTLLSPLNGAVPLTKSKTANDNAMGFDLSALSSSCNNAAISKS
jgi:hypothetical protein